MRLCKRLAILTCKHCKHNLCYAHAVEICHFEYRTYPDVEIEDEIMHNLDGVIATYCTMEVSS